MKAVVIGGGISGLSAAYRIRKEAQKNGIPIELTLLEGSERLGGIVSTTEYEGAVIENGPDSFITTKPEGLALANELGLGAHVIHTNSNFRRAFIAFRNTLHPMPEGFVMIAPSQILPLLTSKLFSVAGKLRMLADVIIPATKVKDESLASFVRRRLGQEALERVAQPMLAGVYTADPETLSLRSTMPQFLQYEEEFGSVIVGLQEDQKRKAAKTANQPGDAGARYSMFVSFDRGMRVLTDALEREIGAENIKLNAQVTNLERVDKQWVVKLSSGTELTADAVVITTPSATTAKLLAPHAPALAEPLSSIRNASSAVLTLVYRREDIPHPLDGFGFVVPLIEKKNIIACTFSSVKFPDRTPPGMATLRVFLGGALKPEQSDLSDDDYLKLALKDLKHYLGISIKPVWHSLARWKKSMPQYLVGHRDLVDSINNQLNELPGIFVSGSAYSGVGIPDCIRSGDAAARQLADYVRELAPTQSV